MSSNVEEVGSFPYSTKQLQPAVVNSVQFWRYLPGDQRQIPV